jgi:hypothetical protein
MLSILSLLIVLIVSLLIVRIATVALTLTGLSWPLARFQARSAFTGAGFTTTESEKVVRHPVRRRIIMLLMLLGNAGIVTAATSLILAFVGTESESGLTSAVWFRLTILAVGLAGLWTITHSHWVDDHLSRLITWTFRRWTDLEVRDYAGLLRLSGDYAVVELEVRGDDWLCGRQLAALNLTDEGVLVLGIEKADGTYLGAPRGKTQLAEGDTAILYGPQETLSGLDRRRLGTAGDREHREAVDKQREVEAREGQ